MIFPPGEIGRAIDGALLLLRSDPAGMQRFDVSVEGFWRSFGVLLLLLPAFAIFFAFERAALLSGAVEMAVPYDDTRFYVSRLAALVLGWVDYPLVLALIAGPLGFGRRYVPLVVALNWVSILAVLPMLVPPLLALFGFIDIAMASQLGLFALGLVLWYQYRVTRIAAAAPRLLAAGLVVLDLVLTIGLSDALTALAGF